MSGIITSVSESEIVAAGAQTTSIGFLDRFDDSSRYAENATLTHNVSMPYVGSAAYRIAVNGSPAPKIVSGALESQGTSLYYFANQVTTTGGKCNLGFLTEWKRSADFLTASLNGGFTVAMGTQWLVDEAGSIGGLAAIEPLHITIKQDGISDASIYNGVASLTCLNATAAAGVYPWNSRGTTLPYGEKQAILFRVNGDILEVEAVGVGTLYFTHPDISAKVSATTYFFFEPTGPTLHRQSVRLYRWWANADELDQLAGYGVSVPESSGGPHRFSGRLQIFPNGRTAQQCVDSAPGLSTAALVATSSAVATKGSFTRPSGGVHVYETQIVQNYGYNEVGNSMFGFMVGSPDTNLNAVVSSTAGAETNLANCGFTPLAGAENADWQEWIWNGTLVGANNKRIRLNLAFGGGDPGTPGNLIDSGTITTAGFYEIRLVRYTNSTASHTFYATMHANGVLVSAQRTTWNGTTNSVGGSFKTTTTDAGGVTVDAYRHLVARVNAV